MAGEAKTSEFLLSTATVMIGPAADVFGLTPDKHSLGLAKNVQVQSDVTFTDLTQGVQQLIVASVNTGSNSKITSEIYEFTARNFAYGAQLDGGSAGFDALTVVGALSADAVAGTAVDMVSVTGLAAGDYIALQDSVVTDKVHIGKIASVASLELTLTANTAIPAGVTFDHTTTVVYKVHAIKVGAVAAQPVFGAKLVGLLPGSGQPVTLIFPKVKITKGISLAFDTQNFSNMPFEFTPYALVPADPHYAEFGSQKTWSLFRS